jgi:hypothetical protein
MLAVLGWLAVCLGTLLAVALVLGCILTAQDSPRNVVMALVFVLLVMALTLGFF